MKDALALFFFFFFFLIPFFPPTHSALTPPLVEHTAVLIAIKMSHIQTLPLPETTIITSRFINTSLYLFYSREMVSHPECVCVRVSKHAIPGPTWVAPMLLNFRLLPRSELKFTKEPPARLEHRMTENK